jgi:hypothetical protein
MKTIVSLLLLGAVHASAAEKSYINFVRQIQQQAGQNTGVMWDMPVAPVGEGPSPLSLDKDAAVFQLWTIEQSAVKDYLLDQKIVATYLPTSHITVTTLDPYPRAVRTRVDKPFSVTVNITGLVVRGNPSREQSSVLLKRCVGNYPVDHPLLDPAVVMASTPYSSRYLNTNGDTVLDFPASALTAADPTKASGEEFFSVHILPDQGYPLTQIASAHVQVWPVASGAIRGIAQGDRLRFQLPQIELLLNDLYPTSKTYLLLYEGDRVSPSEPVVVTSYPTERESSESRVLRVTGLDSKLTQDGTYTLALVSDTVYGRELLCDPVTFTTDRTLRVNGMLTEYSE